MWNDSCRWARQRLPLLAGGELVGSDRRKAERHLIGCAGCRTRLASLHASLNVLHLVAAEPVAKDTSSLWPDLARQIRESRRPAATFWSQIELRPFPLAWMTTGVAAAVLVAGGLLAATFLPRGGGNVPATAEASPKGLEVLSVADLKPRDADVGAEVAEGTIPRTDAEIAIPPAPANNPSPPRGSVIKTSGSGGINASMEATH